MSSFTGYERELKAIFQGEDDAYLRRFPAIEQLRDEPFLVVRGAGSMGMDLFLARANWAFPVEVKSSHTTTVHFTAASGRAQEQYEELLRVTHRARLPCVYAMRLIGGPRDEDPWRVFQAGKVPVPGGIGKVGKTKGGARALRWEEGAPLHIWIEILQAHEEKER